MRALLVARDKYRRQERSTVEAQASVFIGRSERIRTSGPCLPKTALASTFPIKTRFVPVLITALDPFRAGFLSRATDTKTKTERG